MSKFIFVSFPDKAKAYEGIRALEALHAEGSLTLYGTAVVSKGKDGKLFVKRESDRGPLGVAVGSVVGGWSDCLVARSAQPLAWAAALSWEA